MPIYQSSITQDIIQIAETFANDRASLSWDIYAKRGESNFEKQKEDIIAGAIGELCFYNYYSEIDSTLSKPDFSIHEVRKKSFSPDLSSERFRFHIKTQTKKSADIHKISWIFQKNDPLYANPKDNDIIIMNLVDIDSSMFYFIGAANASNIKEHSGWGSPNSSKYAETKVALYFDDLKKKEIIVFS